jgi:Zn-dependent protease
MLGWSFNLFRVRGIQLAVHFSFLLLLAYVADEGWKDDGAAGLMMSVTVILLFFTCVVLHELGHSFTAIHYGVGVRRILLMPIGGMAEFDSIPRRPRHELLITLAGPAVNFAIAAVLGVTVGLPRNWSFWSYADYPSTVKGVTQLLLHWNLVMGCFNLAPIFPMDGGRILRALLAMKLPYLRATFWAATVGNILAGLAILLVLLAPFLGLAESPNYLLAALFTFIFLAGKAEYRSVKRQEQENAYWREIAARVYSAPPAPEPPILQK